MPSSLSRNRETKCCHLRYQSVLVCKIYDLSVRRCSLCINAVNNPHRRIIEGFECVMDRAIIFWLPLNVYLPTPWQHSFQIVSSPLSRDHVCVYKEGTLFFFWFEKFSRDIFNNKYDHKGGSMQSYLFPDIIPNTQDTPFEIDYKRTKNINEQSVGLYLTNLVE